MFYFLSRCVEILIDFQVKSRKDMLSDIQALYRAESTAEKKLDNIIVRISLFNAIRFDKFGTSH